MQLQWEAEKPFLVAARSELFTVLINLSGVPASAEERFLRMQALRYSPYKEFAIHVARLDKTHCLMWGWDANWEREHRQGLPRELQKAPLIPETVLHPCGDSGAYLRACGAGYELQVWKETRLEISRWYPERPEGGALDTALRAEGVEALSGADEAVQWLPRPWPEEVRDWYSLLRNETSLFTALASVALFALCLELGLGATGVLRNAWAESRVETLSEQVGDSLQQRLQVERQRDINTQWLSVFEPFSQLEVLGEFTAALAGSGYELREWEYVEGSLQVVLFDEDIETRDVVSRLDQRELFSELRIEPGRREGESILTMQLPAAGQYRQALQ